jgi:hypothetical protein
MSNDLVKQSTIVKKGRPDANPVYTGGKAIKFIALPVDQSGKVSLASSWISFKGCFGGDAFFSVLETSGKVLKISTRIDPSIPHIDNYLAPAPALMPILNPNLFMGIQVIVPILERPEAEDKEIIFYLG